MKNHPTSAIILVPEITKGMKSIGSKALLQGPGDKCILQYQVSYLKKYYPEINIFIATGFEHEKIKKKFSDQKNISFIYNEDYANTNHGQSIKLYLKIDSPKNLIIITNGVLLKKILPITNQSSVYSIKKQKSGFSIGFNETIDNIDYLFYDLPIPWIECAYLNEDAISILKTICSKNNIKQLFLFEIINLLLDKNIDIKNILINNKDVMKITNNKDTSKIKNFYDKTIYTKS